jgi:uncharacterized protein
VIRLASLRTLVFALTTTAAAGSLVACRSAPPTVIVHTAEKADPAARQMTVTGTATMQIAPDCADLTMTLTGESMRPGPAVDKVRKQQDALLAALRKIGLEDSQLKLSTLGIEPVYEWTQSKQIFKGYVARITLTATTKQFEQIGPMMEAGADAGATQMSSQFRRSDLDDIKRKVREQALLAAKAKAEQTASTLGITLGKVTAVNEASASYLYSNAYFPRLANMTVQDTSAPAIVALGAELQPLTLDINVTYELGGADA